MWSQPSAASEAGATVGPLTRISSSSTLTSALSSGLPAEPSLRSAFAGARVATWEQASVRP